jgi:hypothetical protein
MIDQDFLFFVLKQSREDWVSFAEMRLLYVEALGTSNASDEKFWPALEEMLLKGYLLAGDIEEKRGFVSWTGTASESVASMKTKAVGKARLALSDVCWFDLTKFGELELRKLEGRSP